MNKLPPQINIAKVLSGSQYFQNKISVLQQINHVIRNSYREGSNFIEYNLGSDVELVNNLSEIKSLFTSPVEFQFKSFDIFPPNYSIRIDW